MQHACIFQVEAGTSLHCLKFPNITTWPAPQRSEGYPPTWHGHINIPMRTLCSGLQRTMCGRCGSVTTMFASLVWFLTRLNTHATHLRVHSLVGCPNAICNGHTWRTLPHPTVLPQLHLPSTTANSSLAPGALRIPQAWHLSGKLLHQVHQKAAAASAA